MLSAAGTSPGCQRHTAAPSWQTFIWHKTALGRSSSIPGVLGGWMSVWVRKMLESIS